MILSFFSHKSLEFQIAEKQRYEEICQHMGLTPNEPEDSLTQNENKAALGWELKAKSVLLWGIEELDSEDAHGKILKDERGKNVKVIGKIREKGWSLLYLQHEESPLLKRKANLAPKTATFVMPPHNEESEKKSENSQPKIHKQHERKSSSNAIFKKMGTIFNCINKNSNNDSPERKNENDVSQEKASEVPLKIDPRIQRIINLSKPPYFAPNLLRSNNHSRSSSGSENEMPRLTPLEFNAIHHPARSTHHSRSSSNSGNEVPRLQPSQPNSIPHDLSLQNIHHSRNNSNSDYEAHRFSSQPIPIAFNPRLNPYDAHSTDPTPILPKSLLPVASMNSEPNANIRAPERNLPPLHSEPKFKNSKKPKIVVVDYSHKFLLTFPPRHILFPPHLHTLNLSHNQLSIIPEIVYNLHIKTLVISHNKIKEIGDKINKLEALEHFDISYNKLEKVSNNLTKLSNLKVLNVEGNQLTVLPKQMGSLMKLEELNISLNAIEILPNQLLWLKKLRVFKVTKSYLSESAILIAKGLKRQGNRINDTKSQ